MNIHPTHPWIDSAHAPVYHLTYPRYDAADPRQLAKYTSEHTALYATLTEWTKARRRAYGFTIDLSQVYSTAVSRQRAIQYTEKIRERGSPFMACRAYVTPTEAVRGVMTAVFWHSPPNYPHALFDNVAEARSWALAQTLALDVQQGRAAAAGR
jgi:hypothetical protein